VVQPRSKSKGKEEAKEEPAETVEDARKKPYAPPGSKNKKPKVDTGGEDKEAKAKAAEAEEKKASRRRIDEDRLAALAQPKPVKAAAAKKEDSERERGDEKAKAMIDGVTRGKNVDFESYLDRDVPVMSDKVKKKLTGPLPEVGFDASGSQKTGGSRKQSGS
jgi:hypothetical protein